MVHFQSIRQRRLSKTTANFIFVVVRSSRLGHICPVRLSLVPTLPRGDFSVCVRKYAHVGLNNTPRGVDGLLPSTVLVRWF